MYRVVIVDDEPVIRKGLRETIEWDSLNLEISGEAGNGMEAFELVKANKPHILITDIRMPEMDGIELIDKIKSLALNIKIIILSGYSDYAFLKEAIKLGVQSYLLKPIDNDELISNLIDSVNSIEKEIFQTTQHHQGIELLKSNTLNRLATNAISLSEFEEKMSFLNITLEAEKYLCAVCAAENIRAGAFGDNEQLAAFAMQNICKELAEDVGIVFIDAEGRIVFLFFDSEGNRIYNTINKILSNIVKEIQKYLGITMSTGVGITVSSIENIWESYESAIYCLDYSIFIENSEIIWYDKIESCDSQGEDTININYELIKSFIKSGKKDEFFDYADGIFKALYSTNTVSIDYVRNFIMQLVIKIMDFFRELAINAADDDAASIVDINYVEFLRLKRIKDFRNWFNRLFFKMFDGAGKLQGKVSMVVNHVILYIEDHYNESLTLKQMADIYRINTSYLGQIFKKETGESFTDYINKYRIQKAKELLSSSSFKVYEVAQRVGFADYHYFLKIFKKVTGINPTEIRS